MTSRDWLVKPAYVILEMLQSGELSVDEYVARIYERIEALEPCLNAFITVRPREVVEREVRESLARGSSLAGLLVAVKDNISTRGLRTTCASKMLEEYTPPYDATVVERLKSQGAVILGKTNMDEFAMGSTSELSYFGPVKNPWDTSRVPGGSSGGSAVAVAVGEAPVALGSDTGGSIRLPAAWCGVYGLKPTYGLVSRYGLVAYADSLEQIGPLARHPRDLSLVMEAIAGFDERDSTTLRVRSWSELPRAPSKPRLAVLRDIVESGGVDERVAKEVYRFADVISSKLGWVVEEVRLEKRLLDLVLPTYYVIAMSEASSNLARYTGLLYGPRGRRIVENVPWTKWFSDIRSLGFGWEVKRRIFMGAFALSAGYRSALYEKALRVRRVIRDELLKILERYDALILPASVSPPPRLGEAVRDPLKMYALDLATTIANLTGVPALTIPWGRVEGLPVGVQLLSKPLFDRALVELAEEIEATLRLYAPPPVGEACKS